MSQSLVVALGVLLGVLVLGVVGALAGRSRERGSAPIEDEKPVEDDTTVEVDKTTEYEKPNEYEKPVEVDTTVEVDRAAPAGGGSVDDGDTPYTVEDHPRNSIFESRKEPETPFIRGAVYLFAFAVAVWAFVPGGVVPFTIAFLQAMVLYGVAIFGFVQAFRLWNMHGTWDVVHYTIALVVGSVGAVLGFLCLALAFYRL